MQQGHVINCYANYFNITKSISKQHQTWSTVKRGSLVTHWCDPETHCRICRRTSWLRVRGGHRWWRATGGGHCSWRRSLSSPAPPPEPPAGTVRWPSWAHMVRHQGRDTERGEGEVRRAAGKGHVTLVGCVCFMVLKELHRVDPIFFVVIFLHFWNMILVGNHSTLLKPLPHSLVAMTPNSPLNKAHAYKLRHTRAPIFYQYDRVISLCQRTGFGANNATTVVLSLLLLLSMILKLKKNK